MPVGAQPWYLQFFWWAANIIQVVYPIALIAILLLAWLDFRRLVDHYSPRGKKAEIMEEKPSTKVKEEELEF